MNTLQTPSGSARNTPFSKASLPRELVDIAILSALGWSMCLFVAIYSISAGPGYLGTEIATLAAFP
jgi:hypothetical protein